MPQMAPLNWLTLMFFFIMIFMVFNFFNYYSFIYTYKSMFINFKTSKLNWKW